MMKPRVRKSSPRSAPGASAGRKPGLLVIIPVCALAAVTAIGVTPAAGSPAPTSVRGAASASYTPPTPSDFSAMSWTAAFAALNEKMSREYAFTKWKGINWPALHKKYAPRIAAAEAASDLDAYYLALRSYLHELRDGHVSIKPEDPGLQQAMAGGGLGLIVTKLDNGSVAATWVKAGGPAALAGITRGARILKWNGRPIKKALRRTSTLLSPQQPTTARKNYEQLRYLVRGPVGSQKRVTFRNRDRNASKTVTLTTVDDGLETLTKTDSRSVISQSGFPQKMVEHTVLRGNTGYLRINAEIDLPAELPGDHTPTLTQFRAAMNEFIRAKVSGIIVDVRNNSGGSDQMVADFMSSFYKRRSFYEYQNYVVPQTGKFEIWKTDDVTGEFTLPGQGIHINPGPRRFAGPVVALVNNGCISSGEGVAMGIQRLPQGKVVGFYGTNGSFGMVGAAALMPGPIEIGWPYGQSLNKNKVVQLDSRNGKGGVMPDKTVPMNLRNAIRNANGTDVVLAHGLKVLRQMARGR